VRTAGGDYHDLVVKVLLCMARTEFSPTDNTLADAVYRTQSRGSYMAAVRPLIGSMAEQR
jgi:hypothetical protein